jgi:hypothetical protein
MPIRRTSCHVNAPIFGHSLAKPQNQPNKAFQQKSLFKIYIMKFRVALKEEISHAKIAKVGIQTI